MRRTGKEGLHTRVVKDKRQKAVDAHSRRMIMAAIEDPDQFSADARWWADELKALHEANE